MTSVKPSWKPLTEHAGDDDGGKLTTAERKELPDTAFAFPGRRAEPLTDAAHVRTALARFDQVQDVSDGDRDLAFANILAAAKHYGVDVAETSWKELGKPRDGS
jgi:hypothetical protein